MWNAVFKGLVPQILLYPILNTLSHLPFFNFSDNHDTKKMKFSIKDFFIFCAVNTEVSIKIKIFLSMILCYLKKNVLKAIENLCKLLQKPLRNFYLNFYFWESQYMTSSYMFSHIHGIVLQSLTFFKVTC